MSLQELTPLAARAAEARQLADLAAGQGANTLRMTLSSFVLAARLEEVAAAASQRLLAMTSGRYSLIHTDARRGAGRSGLGLLACDAWTGVDRDTSTLSGGETFLASLSLALGLADVVTAEAGGTRIEALFVDEGFGSLDEDTLEEVMTVLDGLREGGRMVGIVSHVAELKQRIPAQVRVHKGHAGSHVTLSTPRCRSRKGQGRLIRPANTESPICWSAVATRLAAEIGAGFLPLTGRPSGIHAIPRYRPVHICKTSRKTHHRSSPASPRVPRPPARSGDPPVPGSAAHQATMTPSSGSGRSRRRSCPAIPADTTRRSPSGNIGRGAFSARPGRDAPRRDQDKSVMRIMSSRIVLITTRRLPGPRDGCVPLQKKRPSPSRQGTAHGLRSETVGEEMENSDVRLWAGGRECQRRQTCRNRNSSWLMIPLSGAS